MKPTPHHGRHPWVLLAVSVALLGAVIVLRKFRPVTRPDAEAALPALRAECGALAMPDAQEVARWRERQTTLGAQKWTEPARAALVARIGPQWSWIEATADAGSHRYRLAAAAAGSVSWPEIVATVAKLEATPGLTVEAFEIHTGGTRSTRSFAAVEIRVRLQWAGAGPENTFPPESVRRDRVLTTAGRAGTSRRMSGPVRARPSVRLRPMPAPSPSLRLRRRAPSPVRRALRPARPPATRPGVSGKYP